MAKANNDLQFQSYIFTASKYNFSVYEKRILYRLIQLEQKLINQEVLDKCVKVDASLFGDKTYRFPTSWLLASGETDDTEQTKSKNNTRFINALKSLQEKFIEYENSDIYGRVGIISKFEFEKRDRFITFKADQKILEMILDFSKGWRSYELKTAFNLKSQYAMRFYELIGNKNKPIEYGVNKFLRMFGLEDKYKRTDGSRNLGALKRFVIDKAKSELDKISPYTFDYRFIDNNSKIVLYPIFQAEFSTAKIYNRNKALEDKNIYSVLSETEIKIFIEEFGFTESGLKSNYDLFNECKGVLPENYSFFFFQTARTYLKTRKPRKIQGAVIGILKNMLNDYKSNQKRT